MRYLNIARAEKKGSTKPPARRKKTSTLLEHLEAIVEMAEDSKLSDKFLRKVKPHTRFVRKVMNLTHMQAILVALFLENSNDTYITLDEFSKMLGCRTIRFISMMSEIDGLEQRRIVRKRVEDKTVYYRVPNAVVEAVKNNRAYTPKSIKNLTNEAFFEQVDEWLQERENKELSQGAFLEDVDELIAVNQQLAVARVLKGYNITVPEERMLLYIICILLVIDDDDQVDWFKINSLFDKRGDLKTLTENLKGETTSLQTKEIIQFGYGDGLFDTDSFGLTEKAKAELFSEIKTSTVRKPNSNSKEILKHGNITPKLLYYNAKESEQVAHLTGLLRDENLQSVQNRLAESGMRKGFACLFYGAPGTGKTETAYQIARQTGRDIFVVDVSEMKSMWVGESEKKIKALFDRYRKLATEAKPSPILLFNESDALINKRHEGNLHSVDKMENAMQNIILQEMETLDGIMIATTNLTGNLDRAFERRFLYKIEFSKPSTQAQQLIWQAMLPALSASDAHSLAKLYELSGGQIENIARKAIVNRVINGCEPSFDELKRHCESEKFSTNGGRARIGF